MDASKDYYAILGVLPNAEDVVVRAAYKALAQRYHPDRYAGGKDEATKRMAEINEAYAVLSNPESRKQYDAARGSAESEYADESEQDFGSDSLEADWKVALKYYPEIDAPRERLKKISRALEFSYRAVLLDGKAFDSAEALAKRMEQQFLELYFGTNAQILALARDLIFAGKKAGAKELNQAIRVLGSNVDPSRVVTRIRAENGLLTKEQLAKGARIKALATALKRRDSPVLARLQEMQDLAANLGIKISQETTLWGTPIIHLSAVTGSVLGLDSARVSELKLGDVDRWIDETLLPAVDRYLDQMGYRGN